jgi:ABC-type uncharacterized transport system permease subunit
MHPARHEPLAGAAGGVHRRGLAGVTTALIHNHLKVPNLLAGILTMTMLYSINIRILGNRANVPVLKQKPSCPRCPNCSAAVCRTSMFC